MRKMNEGKKDAIAEVQRSLREMKQQTQEVIEKNHISLPPFCSSRHYLFHSVNKSVSPQHYTKLSMVHPYKSKTYHHSLSNSSDILIKQQPLTDNPELRSYQPREQKRRQRLKQQKRGEETNSERQPSSRYDDVYSGASSKRNRQNKLNMIIMNSNTIDLMEKGEKGKSISKYAKNKNLTQRQIEMIDQYQSRVLSLKFPPVDIRKTLKKGSKEKISANINTIDVEALGKQEQQLISSYKKQNHENTPQKLTKKRHFRPERKLILRGNSIEKKKKQQGRQIKYSPWEDTIPDEYCADFLTIDNKF